MVKNLKNMRYFMLPTGVILLFLKGLYMAGKRTSDIVKRNLDYVEQDMLKLQQQLSEATEKYESMKIAYHHALACEKTPFK